MRETPSHTPTVTPSNAPSDGATDALETKVAENKNRNLNTTRNQNGNMNTPVVPSAVPAGVLVVESGGNSLHGIQSVACASASNAMPELRNDPLEGLDFDLTCQSRHGCTRRAAWLCVRKCCDLAAYFCNEHHRQKFAELADLAAHGIRTMTCGECGALWRNGEDMDSWRPL